MPTEVRKLRKEAGLTQSEAAKETGIPQRTFEAYDRGDTEPPSDRMDHIRNVLSENHGSTDSDLPDHVRRVRVRHAGAGPGRSAEGEDRIILDKRLFAGSGVDFDDHVFLRIQGSSMEPILSHGQIVYCEEVGQVVGQDIYVYWRGDEQGHVVALISKIEGGFRIEKRGPSREVTRWQHEEGDSYKSEHGDRAQIEIVARVLGAFSRPARELAARQEAAISAATALRS